MSALAIDLFAGSFGWSAGWLELGGWAVGFDIQHLPHHGPVPDGADLVIQDVLTLHGSQFRDAALILASPPCEEFSYMAMPWSKAKAIEREYKSGERDVKQLTALFDACFRIEREACEAAGHHIPLVVENVRGAQKWVGRSRWNFGSFHLFGDVPALMPMTKRAAKVPGLDWNGSDKPGYVARAFNTTAEQRLRDGTKNPGFRFDGSGRSFQSESVDRHLKGIPPAPTGHWYGAGENCSLQRRAGSKSNARKAASAMIARIPLPLSRYIARTYYPREAA